MEYLKPSGDMTGVADYENITAQLLEKRVVYLDKGDFYINKPITLKNYYCVIGISEVLTFIHAVTDNSVFISDAETEPTYLNIKNINIKADFDNSNYAIDIKGSLKSPYTGCSFSKFENIFINGFESGIVVNHCWNTKFNMIRLQNCKQNGLYIAGACNNISIDMFSCFSVRNGIRITTSDFDTTENTNISINNADVEHCEKGVYIYNANNVSIRDIYSEYCNPVIYSYGCNGFSVNGFYSSNDYNFLELYNDAQIENGYFNVKSEFDIGIINLQNISKVIVNNVKTRNLSTGKVYIFKQEIANDSPLFGEIPFYEIESLPHRLRYTSDNFDFEFKTFDNKEKQFHCAYPSIIVVNDKELTALSNDEVKLYKNGIAVAKAVILKDDVLTKGKIYKMVRLLNNSDSYIYKNGDILEVKHNNTTGVDLEIIIRFTDIKYGEYYIS